MGIGDDLGDDFGTPYKGAIDGRASAEQTLGLLRIEIHGGWSVADLIKLLGRLEDGYKAAAALESLTSRASGFMVGSRSQSVSLSADDLLQTVTAFQLAGGLRLASLRSASLRSAPGETKTRGGGAIPFNFVFMGISFSAPYNKCRAGRRLTDLGTEGICTESERVFEKFVLCYQDDWCGTSSAKRIQH